MWENLAANFATTMTGVGIPAKVEMTLGLFMALGLPDSCMLYPSLGYHFLYLILNFIPQ
jgi:hypothetical protein